VFESIYAWGTVSAREGSVLNPYEPTRKRNLLKHVPAIDFTAGIHNAFIPEQSLSYIDDGISKIIPQMKNGRMAVRITGGFMEETSLGREGGKSMKDVVKVVVDFGIGFFSLYDETKVNEVSNFTLFCRSFIRYKHESVNFLSVLFCNVVSGTRDIRRIATRHEDFWNLPWASNILFEAAVSSS
jgi:hypothetical protein